MFAVEGDGFVDRSGLEIYGRIRRKLGENRPIRRDNGAESRVTADRWPVRADDNHGAIRGELDEAGGAWFAKLQARDPAQGGVGSHPRPRHEVRQRAGEGGRLEFGDEPHFPLADPVEAYRWSWGGLSRNGFIELADRRLFTAFALKSRRGYHDSHAGGDADDFGDFPLFEREDLALGGDRTDRGKGCVLLGLNYETVPRKLEYRLSPFQAEQGEGDLVARRVEDPAGRNPFVATRLSGRALEGERPPLLNDSKADLSLPRSRRSERIWSVPARHRDRYGCISNQLPRLAARFGHGSHRGR